MGLGFGYRMRLAGLVRQSGKVGLGFGYRMVSRVSIIAVWCTCIIL